MYNSNVSVIVDNISNVTTSERNSENDMYVEDYHVGIKTLFVGISLVSVTASILAIVSLRRSRKTPESAKFLATGLLTIDCVFVVVTSGRKFVLDPFYNTNINVLGTVTLQLAYSTVAVMSVERFLLFYRPMKYMRTCSQSLLRSVVISIWVFVVGIFMFVRYGICYFRFKNETFYVAGRCNQIVTIHYSLLVMVVLLTSTVCYFKIFIIVREKSSRKDERKLSFNSVIKIVRGFKTTSLVLVYLFVVFATSVSYAFIIVFIRFFGIGISELRLSLEGVSLINCILDPFLYVLWFRECQMEVLKMFTCLGERIKTKVVKMRMDIYDILPYEQTTSSVLSGETGSTASFSGKSNPAFVV